MSEQQDIIASFDQAGVLEGIRWAYISAASRVLEDCSEAAGHDATVVGITRFALFRDRLDRVFACGRYAVPVGSDAAISLDLLHAELTERDIDTMPQLAPDLVVRANLNGSPGWVFQGRRWLLASCVFGKIDELPWPRKSPTKQRVAQQPNPDPGAQASLFDGLDREEVGALETLLAAEYELDLETLVVAHSQGVDDAARELVLGRARLNIGGGEPWHWHQDLLTRPPADGHRRVGDIPPATDPDTVPDAPVRLRRPASERPGNQASGDQ